VYYTSKQNCTGSGPNSPGCDEHVAGFTRSASNPNVADPSSEHPLLTIPHPLYQNHNGGQLQFGRDGSLYISTGDGGDAHDPQHNAQNQSSLLGKILKMDPATGHETMYAYGLRNPWRFSFDRLTGNMVIGDVGQGAREEIDFVPAGQPAGANYGWPCYEGSEQNSAGAGYDGGIPLPGETPPLFGYGHFGGP